MVGRELSRRTFVQSGTAAMLSASAYGRVRGANERVSVGFIGYGLIGRPHVIDFKRQPDVNMVAVAEAHQGRLDEAAALIGGDVRPYRDFRKVLDDPEVDAVVISTPDHWHALMTMMACAAGKDVYVEKPLTRFVREGRWMVDVARRHGRVVQVGTQQRSGPHYQTVKDLIRDGGLGDIVGVQVDFVRNLLPGFGNPPDEPPPPELDWEMFTGPAMMRPYNRNRGIYQFRWQWDYSGGQMTNWGAHALDIVHWYLDVEGPVRVSSSGGRRFLQDNCDTPDVQDTILEYPGWNMSITIRDCCQGDGGHPLGFYGTKGSLHITRGGYRITPDRVAHPYNRLPLGRNNPVGGPQPVPERRPRPLRTEPVDDRSGSASEMLVLHVRDFLDCVKSRRQPHSDLESGHRVATALHLANISLRVGRQLRWDVAKEEIVGDPEASSMLEVPYRPPWDAQLRALKAT